MSKRNFILLIILITIIALVVLTSFISTKPKVTTGGETVAGQDTNFFSNFLTFTKKKNTNTPNEQTTPSNVSDYDSSIGREVKLMTLTKVSSMPVAGYGVFLKERFVDVPLGTPTLITNPENTGTPGTSTSPSTTVNPIPTAPLTEFVPTLRYVNKSNGNIYQTFADTINERKFSQTTVIGVYDAYFGDNGKSVIMRYLKGDGETIASFAGSSPNDALGADTNNNDVVGSFLPENVEDLSISPDTEKVFYLSKTAKGIVGVTATPTGIQKTQIFDSPFSEWLSSWPNMNIITLTTKASGFTPGYMYDLDPNQKTFNKVLGGISGLTTLTSPNGKLVLYSNNNLSFNVYNIETKKFQTLKIKTLPEKCIWGRESTVFYCLVPTFTNQLLYPDAWYQGEISFSDQIWKIDMNNLNETMILDPILSSPNEQIDGIKPMLDENENYLFFMNKKDNYLWELKLK